MRLCSESCHNIPAQEMKMHGHRASQVPCSDSLMKVARSMNSARDSTLYLTLSPCKDCSKLVHQAGIKRLVFINGYKDQSGVDFLKEAGVEVVQLENVNLDE